MRSTLSQIGKYELRSVLARTGTSVVYDGWDADIARRVAVKTVPLSSLEDSDTREALTRFKRGVQAAGQLAHPNVINIYDYGETDEYAFIVMEFIDGPTLKQLLDGEKRFDIRSTCNIMNGILDGLQYSHDRGVVHRDMKPANIMFTKDQRVKITDFGIARLEDSNMTQTGMVIGTPAYMSPEQFMGEKVDWRSDIYSAGVVLYHLITGGRPYEGNLATIMNKVLNSPVPRPSVVSKTVSPLLDEIVTRAMAKKREHRFQSAAEMNAALQSVLAQPVPAPRPAATPRVESSFAQRSGRRQGFRPSPVLVAGVVIVIVGTGLGATLYLRQSAQEPIAVAPEPPHPAPDSSKLTEAKLSALPSDSVPGPPDVNRAPPPVDPTPEVPVPAAPAPSFSSPDYSSKSGGDLAPPTILPAPSAQDPSPAGAEDQRAPQSTQPPEKLVPSGSKPPPHTPVARGPERPADTVRKSGMNNAAGRPTHEASPLQKTSPYKEALNRPRNGNSRSLSPAPSNGPEPENPLQTPPEYAITSVSAVGLVCQTVTPDVARELGLGAPRGLLVTGVTAGSPAAKAGIRSNDVLLKVNGVEVHDISKLEKMAAESPGHSVPVELFQHGAQRTVQLQAD